MKKKLISLLCAAGMLSALFAGCGTSDTDTAQSTASEAAEETTETADAGSDEPIYIGVTSIVKSMDPTDSSVPWSLTSHGVSETLYTQNEEGNLVTRFVESLEQVDELTWELTLIEGLKFSDGSDVDAEAVAACMNEIMQNNELATASAGVITFTATDTYSLTLETERETKIMSSVLCEWTNIIYKEVGDGEYVFTGPYMIENLDVGVSLEMTPNPYYDDQADERSDVTLLVFQDTASMQQAFESGEIDMAFTVTPEIAATLEDEGFTVKTIDAGYQYFSIVNLQNEPLDDDNVRQAINLAINREDMVTALNGGSVATGIFAHYYSFAGEVEVEYDLEEAASLLEESGWELNEDGYREKDGEVLSLQLVTYASRPDLTTLMQLAASNLNDLGIEVTTEIVDSIDTTAAAGEYDLIFYAQHSAPTGEPVYFLSMFLRTGESKNFNGYSSDEVDSLLDTMGTLELGDERDELAKEIQEIVYEDLPILYLVDPEWYIAVSDRLADYQPYCGDYFVVNDTLGLN